jgi:hypothetical protein
MTRSFNANAVPARTHPANGISLKATEQDAGIMNRSLLLLWILGYALLLWGFGLLKSVEGVAIVRVFRAQSRRAATGTDP